MDAETHVLQGFFRCICGKPHSYAGISITTMCSCGEQLWPYVA